MTATVTFDAVDTPPVPPSGDLPTLTVSSASGAWTFGQAIKRGAAPQYLTAGTGTQVEVRNRWDDGSVKFCVISAQDKSSVTLAASATDTMLGSEVALSSSPASVTFTGAVTGTYACPTTNTVGTWSKATAHLVRKITGPVMTERHYYVPTTDAHVAVWFHVRSYSSGATWVETIIENGWARVASPAERAYGVTVTVGGTSRYSASLAHYHHTRWSRQDWVGTDPGITPAPDMVYLRGTKLVPNYLSTTVNSAYLASLPQTPAPFVVGTYELSADGTGEHDLLGILPRWEAAYVVSGDVRAYRAMLVGEQSVNALSMDGYAGCVTRDESTGLPINIPDFYSDSYSNWYSPTYSGKVYLGTNSTVNGVSGSTRIWKTDKAHSGSAGYLPYLVTGRWFSLETCLLHAGHWHLTDGVDATGSGPQPIRLGQDRACGWMVRNFSQAAAICPDLLPTLKAGYLSYMTTFFAHWSANEVGLNNFGIRQNVYNFTDYGPAPYYTCGAFQQAFVAQCFAHGYEIAGHTLGTTAAQQFLTSARFHGGFPVGMAGTSSGHCYRRSGQYNLIIGPARATRTWYTTWAEVYAGQVAVGGYPAGETCAANAQLMDGYGGVLPTLSGSAGASNVAINWAALVYAAEIGVTGATEARQRVETASNFSTLTTDWALKPQFGILPR